MRLSLALIALGIAVSAAFAASAVAQSRFLVWTYQGVAQPTTLAEIDVGGTNVRAVATLPRNFNPYRIVMAEDNRDVLVLGRRGSTSVPIILRVTPAGAVTTAIVQNLSAGIYAAVRDADGNWLMVRSSAWPQRTMQVLRVGLGGTSTLFSSSTINGYAARLDPDTGDLLVRGQVAALPVWITGYYRIDLTSSAVTSVHVPPQNAQVTGLAGAQQLGYDVARDGMFELEQDFGVTRRVRIVSVTEEQGSVGLTPWLANRAMIDLAGADGRSFPVTHHVLTRSTTMSGPVFIDDFRLDGTHAGGRLVSLPNVFAVSSFTRVGSRHLSWSLTNPPNGRSLHLDLPGEAGRAYAVGLSFSGCHPGPTLPDGRMLPLVPDRLTVVSLQGQLPGILARTVGRLGPNGRATVKIDTNALGSQLKGVRIWAAAVVLDPAAPSGIAHVLGPELLAIKR